MNDQRMTLFSNSRSEPGLAIAYFFCFDFHQAQISLQWMNASSKGAYTPLLCVAHIEFFSLQHYLRFRDISASRWLRFIYVAFALGSGTPCVFFFTYRIRNDLCCRPSSSCVRQCVRISERHDRDAGTRHRHLSMKWDFLHNGINSDEKRWGEKEEMRQKGCRDDVRLRSVLPKDIL